MGAAASIMGVPHLLKIKYLSQTPCLAHLTEQQLNDFARCFSGQKCVKDSVFEAISHNPDLDVYIVGTGELELHTIVPLPPPKDESGAFVYGQPEYDELVLCQKKAGEVLVTTPHKGRQRLYSSASLKNVKSSQGAGGKRKSKPQVQPSGARRGFSVPVFTLQARAVQDTVLLLLKRSKLAKFLQTWPDLDNTVRMLTDVNLVELLHRLPMLKDVPDMQLLLLNSLYTTTAQAKGARIIVEGEVGDTMHIVVSGKCAVMNNVAPKAAPIGSSVRASFASAGSSPATSGRIAPAPNKAAMGSLVAALNTKPPGQQLMSNIGKAMVKSVAGGDGAADGASKPNSSRQQEGTAQSGGAGSGTASPASAHTPSPTALSLMAIAKALKRGGSRMHLQSMDVDGPLQKMVAELEPGSYFGEVALVVEIPRTSSVEVTEPGTIATITRPTFSNFIKMCPQVMAAMHEVLKTRAMQNLSAMDTPLFRGVPPEALELVATQCDVRYLQEDEKLLSEGEKHRDMWLVIAGQVKITNPSKEQPWLMGRGEYFGAGGILSEQPRPSSVVATKQTLLLVITHGVLQVLMDNSPALKAELMLIAMPKQISLTDVLSLSSARSALRQFQRSQFASENIDFWEAVHEYTVSRPAARAIRANDVMERFIRDTSKEQVNIDMKMRNAIIKEVEDGHYPNDLFTGAKAEVYKIMERDSLPRFVQSDIFTALLADFGRDEHF